MQERRPGDRLSVSLIWYVAIIRVCAAAFDQLGALWADRCLTQDERATLLRLRTVDSEGFVMFYTSGSVHALAVLVR
jgi:hypothetical protein